MMGNKPINKTIDGENFIIAYLDPNTSIDLLCKIASIIVPTIGSGFKDKKIDVESLMDQEINISMVIDQFFKKFNSKEVKDIIQTLFSQVIHTGAIHKDCTSINSTKGIGNLSDYNACIKLFSGRLKFMFKVAYVCLEVQYADFFDGKDLKEIFADLKSITKNLQQELKE